MAQDRIDSFYDLEELKRNREAALQIVREGTKAIIEEQEKIKGSPTSPNAGGVGAGSKQVKELSDAIKSLVAIQKEEIELAAKMRELSKANTADRAKERADKKAISDDRKLEMANTKEVLALRKEVARQEAELRKLEIAGSKEALAVEKELAKQKELLLKAEIAQSKEAERQKAADRKLEIAGAKEALAIQKELEKQQKAKQAELAKETAESEKAAKSATSLASAYDVLNSRHKFAVKEYQDAAVAGKKSAAELKAMADNANKMGVQLYNVDLAVNKFGRNVGNYTSKWNGLGNSINQITRELPNAAQSMQLFFTSIGNNLPMFFDELVRARDEIRALRDAGEEAPSLFQRLGQSIFSVQTLLSVGVTLLVAYGAEILDWAMQVSNADKALQNYQKALSESAKAESEGISKLYALKAALNDTTNARSSDLAAFNAVKKEYPQYFDYLNTEKASLAELNEIIDAQIKARIENAKQIALNKVAADATNDYVQAQMDLNKEIGVWEKNMSFSIGGSKNLTAETKRLYQAYELLFKEGKIGFKEWLAYQNRIESISDAEKQMTLTTNALTRSLLNLKDAVNSMAEDELIALENNVIKYKEGTKERLNAEIVFINQKKDIKIKELQQEFNGDELLLAGNKRYQEEKKNIEYKAQREIDALYNKGSQNRRATDVSDFDANKRLIAAKAELERQLYEIRIKTNKAILDDESEIAARRIFAAETIEDEKLKQIRVTKDETIRLLENEEAAIAKIEARGAKTSEEKKRVSENNKQAILIEKQAALQKYLQEAESIENETNRDITKIYEQETQKQTAFIKNRLDAIKITGDEEKRVALQQLKDRFQNGEMRLKEYRAKSANIEEEFDVKTLESQKEMLAKEAYNFTNSQEVQLKIRKEYNSLSEQIELKEFDTFVRTEQEKESLRQQIAQRETELAQETVDIIATINKAKNDQEIADFEKKKQLLKDDAELERLGIDSSMNGDVEKANLKKVLLAEEGEQQDALDKKIRNIKRKQAIADKVAAISQIGIQTALAVAQINANAAVNADVTQTLRATLSALVIGVGAAQALKVAATPLPEYAKGKKASDSYEGLAIAGEAGTEMKIDKDGKLELLTKPTLIHTKRGDTILSNEQLRKGELGKHIKTDAAKSNYDELIRAYSYNTDKLVKAVKNSGNNVIIDNSNYNLNIQKARA